MKVVESGSLGTSLDPGPQPSPHPSVWWPHLLILESSGQAGVLLQHLTTLHPAVAHNLSGTVIQGTGETRFMEPSLSILVRSCSLGSQREIQKASGKIHQENPWCQSAMSPSPYRGGAGLVPKSRSTGGSGRSSLGSGAGLWGNGPQVSGSSTTSCQNKDQDGECWVCPSGWPGMFPPPQPRQGHHGTGLLRPWGCSSPAGCACLPGGHTCHPSLHAVPCLDTEMPSSCTTLFPARQTSSLHFLRPSL